MEKKLIKYVVLITLLFFIVSCVNLDNNEEDKEEIVHWEILEADIIESIPVNYRLFVIENSRSEFSINSDQLSNFDYEYPYSYKLKVLKRTYYNIQDAVSPQYSYKLIEILSENNKK